MPGYTSTIERLKKEIALRDTQTRERIALLVERIDALEERLDKYDKPVHAPGKGGADDSRPARKKNPVAIPPRPQVMQASGVGKDP